MMLNFTICLNPCDSRECLALILLQYGQISDNVVTNIAKIAHMNLRRAFNLQSVQVVKTFLYPPNCVHGASMGLLYPKKS